MEKPRVSFVSMIGGDECWVSMDPASQNVILEQPAKGRRVIHTFDEFTFLVRSARDLADMDVGKDVPWADLFPKNDDQTKEAK